LLDSLVRHEERGRTDGLFVRHERAPCGSVM
jgi:hypothetical protein